MENYKEELQSLKTELNSRIDAVIAKIEKPKFEVGKYARWKKYNPIYSATINDFALIKNVNEQDVDLVWITKTNQKNGEYYKEDLVLMTPKEVEEALTKEAVKRGFKDGVRFKSAVEPNDKDNFIFKSPFDFKINYNNDGTRLWGASSGCIFSNGKWATPIKTKTIDELAMEFDKFCYTKDQSYLSIQDSFIAYSKENKEEIIETLNNL